MIWNFFNNLDNRFYEETFIRHYFGNKSKNQLGDLFHVIMLRMADIINSLKNALRFNK